MCFLWTYCLKTTYNGKFSPGVLSSNKILTYIFLIFHKNDCRSCSVIVRVRVVLKRTVVGDSDCHRQQSFSGLPSPGRSRYTIGCHSRVQTLYYKNDCYRHVKLSLKCAYWQQRIKDSYYEFLFSHYFLISKTITVRNMFNCRVNLHVCDKGIRIRLLSKKFATPTENRKIKIRNVPNIVPHCNVSFLNGNEKKTALKISLH